MTLDQVHVYNLVHNIWMFSYLSRLCRWGKVWEGAHRSASPFARRWNGRKNIISLQGLESVCKWAQGCLACYGTHVQLETKHSYPCGPGGANNFSHEPAAKASDNETWTNEAWILEKQINVLPLRKCILFEMKKCLNSCFPFYFSTRPMAHKIGTRDQAWGIYDRHVKK